MRVGREEIVDALEATKGRVSRAAEELGRSRRAIYNALDRLDLRKALEGIRQAEYARRAADNERTLRELVPEGELPRTTRALPPWWTRRRVG